MALAEETFMADSPVDSNNDKRLRPDRAAAPGAPRWVKMFAVIAVIVLVSLFVIQHLSGISGHH